MVLSQGTVVSSLKRKGFEERRSGRHIAYVYRRLDGRLSNIRTFVSHGARGKDLGPSLVGKMARQCNLSSGEFKKLVDCSLDQVRYEERVREHLK